MRRTAIVPILLLLGTGTAQLITALPEEGLKNEQIKDLIGHIRTFAKKK